MQQTEEKSDNCRTASDNGYRYIKPLAENNENPLVAKLITFYFDKAKNLLTIENAIGVIKIFNVNKELVLIQTAKNGEPLIFNTKKLKKGEYTVITPDRHYYFIKK